MLTPTPQLTLWAGLSGARGGGTAFPSPENPYVFEGATTSLCTFGSGLSPQSVLSRPQALSFWSCTPQLDHPTFKGLSPFCGSGFGKKKFFLRHQNERMNGLSTAVGHRCPVLLSRTSDASLVVWQITHKAPVTGYASERGASPAFSPCSCLPAAGRPSWECLGPARRVATELAPGTLLKTEVGFFLLDLSPAPHPENRPRKRRCKEQTRTK